MKTIPILALAGSLVLTGCAATGLDPMFGDRRPATEVRRVHSGAVAPAAIAIAPLDLGRAGDPLIRAYAGAVGAELGRLGFTPVADVGSAQLLGSITVSTGTAEQLAADAPGPLRADTILYPGAPSTALTVEIRRRADGAILWQGRSATMLRPQGDASSVAVPLARALFFGFPGESGRTISVL